jgi:hypothetical protein
MSKKGQCQTKEQLQAKQKIRYQLARDRDVELNKELLVYTHSIKKQYALKKNLKLQDRIIDVWHTTGELIIPDQKIIKEVEKEIIKEATLYSDALDYVDLDDCRVQHVTPTNPEDIQDTSDLRT